MEKKHGFYKLSKNIPDSDILLAISLSEQTIFKNMAPHLFILYLILAALILLLYYFTRRHNKTTYKIANYELRALQSQINPHFLYNSLNIINCIAIEHQHTEISAMINALVNFYRLSLNHGEDFISFAEEFRHIFSYIEIINLRYPQAILFRMEYAPCLA